MASESKKSAKPAATNEIINQFNQLRQEQHSIAQKLSELEMDLNEYKMVIETLKKVNEDRKCFRMIGGILTERKVKDVLPQLILHQEKLTELIQKMNEALVKKGQELNDHKEKYKIKILGKPELQGANASKDDDSSAGPQKVLVS